MTPRSRTLRALVLLTSLALVSQGLIACGADARQAALRGTLLTLNVARDGFVAWDDGHQAAIVAAAPSLDDGKRELLAYRARRERVVLGFEIAYKGLALAAIDPSTSLDAVFAPVKDLRLRVVALGAAWPVEAP